MMTAEEVCMLLPAEITWLAGCW